MRVADKPNNKNVNFESWIDEMNTILEYMDTYLYPEKTINISREYSTKRDHNGENQERFYYSYRSSEHQNITIDVPDRK